MEREKKDVQFIKGKRLYLRPLLEIDIKKCLEWMNDREVTKFLSLYLPVSEKKEKEWLERINTENNIHFAICNNDGTYIGNIGLDSINWKDRTAVSGCVIGEKDYWGKGYGTEAKMIFLYYIFYELNLRKINSTAIAHNERSIAYHLKCGAKVEGEKAAQIYWQGEYYSEIIFGTFKEDFDKVWQKYKKEHL